MTYLDFTWATLLSNVLALGAAAVLAVAATGVLWMLAGRPPAPCSACRRACWPSAWRRWRYSSSCPGWRVTADSSAGSWLSGMSSFEASRADGDPGVRALPDSSRAQLRDLRVAVSSAVRCQADFLAGGLVYALTSPVRMVNITPGNLGVTEWVVALVGKVLAFDLTTGLIVALAVPGHCARRAGSGALSGSAWLAAREEA